MSLVMLLVVAQLRASSLEPTPNPPTPPAAHVTPPIALAMIGIGGTAMIAGALVGVFGFIPAARELDFMCPGHHCNGVSRPLFDRAGTLGMAANVTMAVGVFYVVAGAAWWIAARLDHAPSALRIAPAILADGPALFAIGRF